MATQQRKRSRRVCHCLFVALGAWMLVGCPSPTPTPPSTSGNVPPCGPRIPRQQLLFGFSGSGPFPRIESITWTISTFCVDTSQGRTFVHQSSPLTVLQPRLAANFAQTPADGFDGLGMGHLLEHTESSEIYSIALSNAQQANWCIRGVVTYVDGTPPTTFGPVTARQVAGSSPFLLNFVATPVTDASGRFTSVTVTPGFSWMPGCVME